MTKQPSQLLFPWLLVLYEVAIYLSMDAYMPALPHIAQIFHTSVTTAQMTVVVWMVGALLPQLFFGPISDRFGRRPMVLLGGVLYVFASFLCAWAPTMPVFLLGRFMQGLAMPSMYIAGYAAINEYFDQQSAIRILARMNGATILAPAFGPILGGAFVMFFDWRWIFVILGVFAALTVVWLMRTMPETLTEDHRINHLHLWKLLKSYGRVCINGTFMTGCFVTFLPTIGLIAWMLAGPFIVVKHFHLTTLDFGLLQCIIFAGFIVGTKLVSRLTSPSRNAMLIKLGMIAMLLGAACAAMIDWYYPNALYWMVAALALSTCGSGLMIPVLSRLSLDASQETMGMKVTIFSLIRVGTGLIGSLCITYFYTGSLFSIALIMLAFGLLGALLWLIIRHKLMACATA